MKKIILLLMLLLPIGGVLQSCSHDENEIEEFIEQELKMKTEMLNEFIELYADNVMSVQVGGVVYRPIIHPKDIQINNGRYVSLGIGRTIDLLNLIGYFGGTWDADSRAYECLLIFR